MRFLVVSPYLPHARIGHGGGFSVYNFLRFLAREHDVTALCFQRAGEEAAACDLPSHGVRLETVPFLSERDTGGKRILLVLDRIARKLKAALQSRPYMVVKYERAAMFRRLEELIDELRPDAVQVEYIFMAPYAEHAKNRFDNLLPLWQNEPGAETTPRPVVLLSSHEAGTLPRLRRLLTESTHLRRVIRAHDLVQWAEFEKRAMNSSDLVLCVTDGDRRLLGSTSGHRHLMTLPLGVDAEGLPPKKHLYAHPPRLLFVGSFAHPPNREAAELLVESIMPRVRAARGDVVLDIVGSEPPAKLIAQAAAGSGATVHGFVDDLDPMYDAAWLFVAPLFSGGGIKIKILEAMGRGSPVLTTPIGLEGIEAEPGTEVDLAADADAFALRIVESLSDPQALASRGEAGRRRILEKYSWAAIVQTLAGAVEERAATDGP